ncbi:MAG: ParB N-terminal domain-containing protein [Rhizobiaceae bacterium]|nr:ParB N-terminal domain-containing protein [Rhizobiaceae bacterium]
MAEFKTIPLADIQVPERLRAVEDDHALAIQASIVQHGLLNPITVRLLEGGTAYALVAGAHRLRAIELLGEAEIDAVIVEADDDEAVMLEVSENLFRNELSALDRAVFIISYREAWERKYGKVARGNPSLSPNSVKFTELGSSPLDQVAQEAATGFAQHVADKLGLSKSAIEKAQFLGQNLHPDLRRALRGSREAENQSLLLKLARLGEGTQLKVVSDVKASVPLSYVLEHAIGRPTAVDPDRDYTALVAAWERAGKKDRDRFLQAIGASMKATRVRMPTLSDLMSEVED